MAKWACVNALGRVTNMVLGGDDTPTLIGAAFSYVVDVTGEPVGIGWHYDGTDWTAPTESVAEAKVRRIAVIKAEGLTRIQAVMPAIADFDALELVRETLLSVAPAARQLTADMQSITDIYGAARTAILAVRAAGTVAAVDAVEVSWPV